MSFPDHNHIVSHSDRFNELPEDWGCPAYWEIKGVVFPCYLEDGHSGPHVNYPKKKGHNAVITWNSQEEPL